MTKIILLSIILGLMNLSNYDTLKLDIDVIDSPKSITFILQCIDCKEV